MNDDLVLLAAGSGPDVNGWLFAIDGALTSEPVIEEIDHLNSSGLAVHGDGVYRILSSPSDANASGDFLAYDATGVVAYRRVDRLADSHGLVWDGTQFVVPCSFTNEIFWLSTTGETIRTWRAPGSGDAWHINGLHVRSGRLYASAFGKFAEHRGWSKKMGDDTGIIFDVETQSPVVRGLRCPHDPIFLGDGWFACDSYTKRIVLVDEATGAIRREAQLNGWTRGAAVTAEHIFVGLSGQRHGSKDDADRARIAIVDRATFSVLGEIPLPCEELTSLAIVPRSLLTGLRRGFRTNDLRVSVQDRRDLFAGSVAGPAPAYTPMRALEKPRDFRVRIRVQAPRVTRCAEYFEAHITIKNRSKRTLFTAPPFPINIGIVFDEVNSDGSTSEVRREALPEALTPGSTNRFTISVQSPSRPGRYRIRFTLLQEWVRWFDTDQRWFARLRSSNRYYRSLDVEPAGPSRAPRDRGPAPATAQVSP